MPEHTEHIACEQEPLEETAVAKPEHTGDSTLPSEDNTPAGDDEEADNRRIRTRKWPVLIAIVIAAALITAIVSYAVAETTPKTHPYTGDAAHATSFEQQAFEANNLGYVAPGASEMKKLNEELVAYQADPRRSYAVNSAFKDAWKSEPVEHKVVYLTFDDGPSSMTPRVLEILARYNAKAAFFVTCQYPDSLHYIKEAYDQGHTIGMHTASHNYSQLYASDEAYFADLDQIAQVVKDQIGYVPCFVRLPGGSSNTISANYSKGIVSRVTSELLNRGYQYYDWSASSGDGGTVNKDQAYANAIKGDGQDAVVILCHDTPAKGSTADALPAIIEYYQSRGYTFKGLDRNTPVTHHAIAN